MPTADARDGFLCLKHDIWPRNERDIVVAKSASFGHGSLVFVVCGWREEAVVGVFPLQMYLVHTTYVLFCTRATVPLFCTKIIFQQNGPKSKSGSAGHSLGGLLVCPWSIFSRASRSHKSKALTSLTSRL